MDYFTVLPPEILNLIFSIDNFNDSNWRQSTFSTPARREGRRTDLTISLLSKSIHPFGNELLYNTLVIFNRFTTGYVYDDDALLRQSLDTTSSVTNYNKTSSISSLVKKLTFDSYHMNTRDSQSQYGLESSHPTFRQILSPFQWDILQHKLLESCTSLRSITLKGYVGSNSVLFLQHLRLIPKEWLIELNWTSVGVGGLIQTSVGFPLEEFIDLLRSFEKLERISIVNAGNLTIDPPSLTTSNNESQLQIKSLTISSSPSWLLKIFDLISRSTLTSLSIHSEPSSSLLKFLINSGFSNIRNLRISLGDDEEPKSRANFVSILEFISKLTQLHSLEIRSNSPYAVNVLDYLLLKVLPSSVLILRISCFPTVTLALNHLGILCGNRKFQNNPISVFINRDGTPSDPPGLNIDWVGVKLFEDAIFP